MKKEAEYLIVGQGIAGILLAFELFKRGKSVMLMDDNAPDAASLSAGAVLNPVNLNRNHVFLHQKEEWGTALKTYHELESLLREKFITPLKLYFFPPEGLSGKFNDIHFLKKPEPVDKIVLADIFNDSGRAYELTDVYHINFPGLKTAWKKYFSERNLYIESKFFPDACSFDAEGIKYHEYVFRKIIFAEGAGGALNPFFPGLPFIKNLGNILYLKIYGLPPGIGSHFDKEKLIPLGNDTFWFGSNYVWNFAQPMPDAAWREHSIRILQSRLKLPFEIISHRTVCRPTTAGQEPLLIRSGKNPNLYLFNGLGTRGFSSGPVLAKRFCGQYIL